MPGGYRCLLGDVLALAGAVLMAGHWLCGRAARRNLPALGYMTLVYLVTAGCLLGISPMLGGLQVTRASLGGIVVLALAKEHGLLVSGGSDFHGIPDRFPTKLGIWQRRCSLTPTSLPTRIWCRSTAALRSKRRVCVSARLPSLHVA